MQILRQSTQIKVRVGPFVAVGDGFTPVTTVDLTAADEAELLKANGAATVSISTATWAAIAGSPGWYDLTLTTSHTDTVGELEVIVQDASLCLPVPARFQVVEEAVYDAMYAASAAGPLQPTVAGRKLSVDANSRVDVGSWLGAAVVQYARSSEVLAIQNTTRSKAIVPSPIERPDSGSTGYKLHLYLYDTAGNPEAPDALPTLTAANQSGVDRSANLGTVTLTSTGAYSVTYTLASGDAVEQLFFEWSYVEAGVPIMVPASVQVVDTTAVDFTAADRSTLDALATTLGTPAGASVSADIAAVPTAAEIDTQLTGSHGAGSWQTGAGGSGSGARTITITVDDGTATLQNTTVRLTEGVNTYAVVTDVNGVAVFNVDDATYMVAATKDGYTFGGASLVVTMDASQTYSMTAVVITPPADPSLSTLTIKCVDNQNVVKAGVTIEIAQTGAPRGDVGLAYDGTLRSAVSNSSGIVTLSVVKAAAYKYRRASSGKWLSVVIGNNDQTQITSVIGSP